MKLATVVEEDVVEAKAGLTFVGDEALRCTEARAHAIFGCEVETPERVDEVEHLVRRGAAEIVLTNQAVRFENSFDRPLLGAGGREHAAAACIAIARGFGTGGTGARARRTSAAADAAALVAGVALGAAASFFGRGDRRRRRQRRSHRRSDGH